MARGLPGVTVLSLPQAQHSPRYHAGCPCGPDPCLICSSAPAGTRPAGSGQCRTGRADRPEGPRLQLSLSVAPAS